MPGEDTCRPEADNSRLVADNYKPEGGNNTGGPPSLNRLHSPRLTPAASLDHGLEPFVGEL